MESLGIMIGELVCNAVCNLFGTKSTRPTRADTQHGTESQTPG